MRDQDHGIHQCSLVLDSSIAHDANGKRINSILLRRRTRVDRQFPAVPSNEERPIKSPRPDIWTEDTLLLLVVAHWQADLTWLRNQREFPYVVGEKFSTEPICGVPINKGAEASTFLRFILNNYDCLPQYLCLLDDHESSWHQPFDMIKKLRSVKLQPHGSAYIPLNGLMIDTDQPFNKWSFDCFRPVWDAVVKPHLGLECPQRIVTDGSSQFIVSRDLILNRSRACYSDLYEYTIGTKRWPGDEHWRDPVGYPYTPGGKKT